MTEVWMDRVNKRDGRLLKNWWNANSTKGYFFVEKRTSGKLYDLMIQHEGKESIFKKKIFGSVGFSN